MAPVRRPGRGRGSRCTGVGAAVEVGLVLVSAVTELAEGYGRHPSLVGHVTAAWFAGWAWAWGAGALSPIFLLFPSGHLPSRRWRPVLGVALSGLVLSCVGGALGHGNDYQMPGGENPYAVGGVVVDAVFAVGQVLFLLGQLAAIASLVARYRKAGPDERRQLAWVAYSVSLLAVAGPAALLLYGSSASVRVAIALVATLIPVSICIAILRYRLYDIDLVVNRTVVYGLLTALLGSGYAMTTLLLGTALGQRSPWATAGATLVVAAAFAPLRTRLQDAVDHRFNRAKYDAFRQVDAFLDSSGWGVRRRSRSRRCCEKCSTNPNPNSGSGSCSRTRATW